MGEALVGDLTSSEVQHQATSRCSLVARRLGARLLDHTADLHDEIVAAIPELRGDDVILGLLNASTEGNVENFLHMLQLGIAADELLPPTAAMEYGRRLAQRGISSTTLLRAYRMGQNRVLALGLTELERQESHPAVAIRAARILQRAVFEYVDHVAERVLVEYEDERERWLANRSTVRAAALTELLAGEVADVGHAESALGYRLRQHHLGLVTWNVTPSASPADLRLLEALVSDVAELYGVKGRPLFLPQDTTLAWAWLPLGRGHAQGGEVLEAVSALVAAAGASFRLAMGSPASGVPGFRQSHREAVRAYEVASLAGSDARSLTAYVEPGLRIASVFGRDLEFTREFVARTLGRLAHLDDDSARLRATVLAFLAARGSCTAAAQVLHLHKNTVRYRVEKAAVLRGRPIDDDRLDVEIALTACQWLGSAVLMRDP